MKRIIQGAVLSSVTASLLMGAGYKIPEQSLNSMALGAAYVAHTQGADTNYYNPANMAFMNDAKHYVEGGVTLANLPKITYTLTDPYSGASEEENIFIPYLHYVSDAYGDFRWGVSLTAPGGLSKRWNTPFQKLYSEEFTLKIIELNPSVSYRINDNFSVGGGVRLVYSEGIVKSDGRDVGAPIRRDMKGDTVEFGYNLAASYRPTEDIVMAVTYRSNVDLKEEGKANLYFGNVGQQYDADVTVPLPAALNIAVSKTWNDSFTLELVYERTYWSEYKTLDFNYGRPIQAPLVPYFDNPLPKEWKDTNTFRIGATIEMENGITGMMGFAIDETPVPEKTIGFELPDSDAKIFSMGFRYQQNENLSWGAAFLYDSKESRTLTPGVADNQVLSHGGTFGGGGAYLTTVGVSYEY